MQCVGGKRALRNTCLHAHHVCQAHFMIIIADVRHRHRDFRSSPCVQYAYMRAHCGEFDVCRLSYICQPQSSPVYHDISCLAIESQLVISGQPKTAVAVIASWLFLILFYPFILSFFFLLSVIRGGTRPQLWRLPYMAIHPESLRRLCVLSLRSAKGPFFSLNWESPISPFSCFNIIYYPYFSQ